MMFVDYVLDGTSGGGHSGFSVALPALEVGTRNIKQAVAAALRDGCGREHALSLSRINRKASVLIEYRMKACCWLADAVAEMMPITEGRLRLADAEAAEAAVSALHDKVVAATADIYLSRFG